MCQNKQATIMHVDMNAFFASCEQVRNPDLQGKPVIVGSDEKRSVVSAASYEARRFGVRAAMPIFKAKELCPEAIFVPVDMKYYVETSTKLHKIFQNYTYKVQSAGLDEAFLDARPALKIFETPQKIARLIIDEVFDTLGLKCTIGIARSKSVAKIASGFAKPAKKDGSISIFRSDNGILTISDHETASFLNSLDVHELYGVGRKTAAKLAELGIVTIPELLETPKTAVQKLLGTKMSETLFLLATGQDIEEVDEVMPCPKSVGREITMPEDSHDENFLNRVIKNLSGSVGSTLRSEKLLAYTVSLIVKTADHIRYSRARTLTLPTNSNYEIHKVVKGLLIEFLKNDKRKIRLIGLSTSNFVSEVSYQSINTLFDYIDETDTFVHKIKTVERIMDKAPKNLKTNERFPI